MCIIQNAMMVEISLACLNWSNPPVTPFPFNLLSLLIFY
jgi:hypothetical protein